jgi:hypothetical protein
MDVAVPRMPRRYSEPSRHHALTLALALTLTLALALTLTLALALTHS